MKIALIGATGRTGRLVLTTALERGHDVTVLVRDSAQLADETPGRVRVVVGDATDVASLVDLVGGADVVVSALGPTGKQGDLHTRTARALVEVMTAHGPRRFVGISAAGIDVPGDQKAVKDKIISGLVRVLGGEPAKDKPAEYAVWAASELDWTLVRPPRLVDGPASARPLEHHPRRSTRSTKITRTDLATFVMEIVEQNLYPRRAPFVATGARG